MEFSSGLPSVVASSPMRVPLLVSSYKKIAVAWLVRGDWIVGFRCWSRWCFFWCSPPTKLGRLFSNVTFLWFEPGVKPPTCVCWFFMCLFFCILSVFLVWTRWNLEIYGKEHLVVCLDTWFGVESFLDEIGGLKVEITNSIIDYALVTTTCNLERGDGICPTNGWVILRLFSVFHLYSNVGEGMREQDEYLTSLSSQLVFISSS